MTNKNKGILSLVTGLLLLYITFGMLAGFTAVTVFYLILGGVALIIIGLVNLSD